MLKVGLVTGSATPSALAAPRTRVVLPAPSSPRTSTTSPPASVEASSAPSDSVSADPEVSTLRAATPRDSRACPCGARTGRRGQKKDRPAGEWCAGRSLLLEGWRQD